MTPANQITAALLDEIPRRFPGVRVWRNNRVKAKVKGVGGKDRFINAGIDGQADISGIARLSHPWLKTCFGIRVEVEVKAGKDRLNEDQHNFRKMIDDHGGIYVVAQDLASALRLLEIEFEKRGMECRV